MMKSLGLLAFLLALPSAPAQRTSRSVAEQYLFQAANAERAQRGLSALHWDDALYRAATDHAIEMARRRSISHRYSGEADLSERGQGAGAHFSVIAENVAEAPNAVTIHDAWMNSPRHRENLLDPRVDSVAISVIVRDGQLYAVQDFERSVADLSLNAQESAVAALITSVVPINVSSESAEARHTCEQSTGYVGARKPYFIMRFTTGELNRLPDALRTKLASGQYREAAVGACATRDQKTFTVYNIAVLLY